MGYKVSQTRYLSIVMYECRAGTTLESLEGVGWL